MEYKKGDYFRKGFSFKNKSTNEPYKFYKGDILYVVIQHELYLGYDVIKEYTFDSECDSLNVDISSEYMNRCLTGSNVIEFKLKRNNEIKTISKLPLMVIGGVLIG